MPSMPRMMRRWFPCHSPDRWRWIATRVTARKSVELQNAQTVFFREWFLGDPRGIYLRAPSGRIHRSGCSLVHQQVAGYHRLA